MLRSIRVILVTSKSRGSRYHRCHDGGLEAHLASPTTFGGALRPHVIEDKLDAAERLRAAKLGDPISRDARTLAIPGT